MKLRLVDVCIQIILFSEFLPRKLVYVRIILTLFVLHINVDHSNESFHNMAISWLINLSYLIQSQNRQ
jgi:hypothetical protein